MNQIQPEFKKRFSNRLVVALILVMIVLPAVWLGNWWIVIFALVGLVFVTHEIMHVRQNNPYPLPIRWFVYLMMVFLIFFVFVRNNFLAVGFEFAAWTFTTGLNSLELSTTILTILALTLFFSSITDVRFKVQDATYLITMAILLSLSFQAFLFLRFYPSFIFQNLGLIRPNGANGMLLVYIAIGTFFTDIGAYLVGTFYGKHKMNVRVSKNKTWEGFFGGVAFYMIGSFTFAIIMDVIGIPLLPFLDRQHWYWLALFALMMPLIATLGDFTFSIIKREFQIKNFSNILGEHGGILDRIDSFSMVCLTIALLITVIADLFYQVG
jgi:phosphatidate cytidylyltransferase